MNEDLLKIVDLSSNEIDRAALKGHTRRLDANEVQPSQLESVRHLHILDNADGARGIAAGYYLSMDGTWLLLQNQRGVSLEYCLEHCGRNLECLNIENLAQPQIDVSSLTNLKYLDICNFSGAPCTVTGLSQLDALEELTLLRAEPDRNTDFSALVQLRALSLTQISDFSTTNLSGLKDLEELYLNDLAMGESLDVSGMKKLRCLAVGNCKELQTIAGIADAADLEEIVFLDIGIRKIPEEIRSLRSLRQLVLADLELEALPPWLPTLGLSIGYSSTNGICLSGTRVRGVDMSIFRQSQEIISKWFEERNKDSTGSELNEVKVVFLGDGEAGKSHCIARLLKGGEVLTDEETPNDSTPGIVITDQSYQIGDRNVQVHFWDFGGQEILHSMHRMFLTERTLYVILINARDDTQDDRARYWLHNVRSFADGAPVLLVLNKMDQNPNASVNETDLRAIYSGLTEVVKLSAKFDDQNKFNGSFTEAMKRQIGRMENLGFFFPASWTRAKQRLLGMTENYIRGSDYAVICEESGIADEGDLRRSLLNWFNDLGVSICYGGNVRLRDYVILRPNWITNAVYAILFNKHPDTRNGIISHNAIFEMIQPAGNGADPYRRTNSAERYTQAEIDFILGVTRKFRLSFQVDGAHEFIPMLCQRESLSIAARYAADPDALEFRMTFDYLPSNVLHRLMVELRQDLDTDHVWRTGARFAQKSSGLSALVKTGGNVLQIYVRGTKKSHRPNTYLCILKDAIDYIVKDMNLTEPLNEVVYKLEGRVQAFDYDELVESLDAGEITRYSKAHKRRLKIEDILNQTGHQSDEARKQLLEDMLTVCAQMQANRANWNAREDDRNTYIRDLLRAKKYIVLDQTLSGESAGGKRAGELDLLIMNAADQPWTLCEAMNLSGHSKSQIEYWNGHLQKLLGCYDANGMPFLFLISYMDCADGNFGQTAAVYYDHLRFYSPGTYALQSAEPLTVWDGSGKQNYYIQTAKCTYDREGFPTTVYHFFIRMGE